MPRKSFRPTRLGVVLGLFGCAAAPSALAQPVPAPVLEVSTGSLTSYQATNKTPVQDLRPRFDQRGVDIDGTLRAYAPLGWTVNADPFGGGYTNGRTLGDVNLFTGSYHPTEVDLALPTLGLPVVIGRTFSSVQVNSTPARYDSDGYQGWNWAQVAQPEIRFQAGGTAADDMVYLIYGADRYIEFKRTGSSDDTFKSKNGAAGVIRFAAGASTEPDTYTYIDQRGSKTVFFGFDGDSGAATGQLWKMIDRAGKVAFVGDATTGSTAISSGFISSTGRVSKMYDASDRRYEFTYDTYGGKTRLKKVEAQTKSGGSWASPSGVASVSKVEYDYYTSTENDIGLAGDLRLVTITQPTDSGSYVRRKYYRYYTRAWNNSDGRRGEAHALKMVVGFEGTRNYDDSDSTFDQDYYGETDANLMPYSEMYFEYASGDSRIWKVTFNGNCGCGGGSSGTYVLTYSSDNGYSGTASYNPAWDRRTIIDQPDSTWVTQYFDETGAVLGRVMTNADPAGSPTKKWITDVIRNSAGQVISIHSPENITGYTHSTGSISRSTSVGLVTEYARRNNSDNLDGLRESVSVRKGTSGSAEMISSTTLDDHQLHVGPTLSPTTGVSVPTLATSVTYPEGTDITTTYTTSYWDVNQEAVLYLAPVKISTAAPAADTGKNGSGISVVTDRAFREDGSQVFSQDGIGAIFYTGRDDYGQTVISIADADPGEGDYVNGDGSISWLTRTTISTKIHAVTTMTYDAQGRVQNVAQPSVLGTRTSVRRYTVLSDGRLATYSFPKFASSKYYGPGSIGINNHAGKVERQATLKTGSSGSSSLPSSTPDSDWSAMVDNVYDDSGMRLVETKTYTSTSTSASSYFGYDAMGRRERVVDLSGTITRTVFDDRGLPIERWVGTNDNNTSGMGGSDDMTKVEAMEYDGSAGSTDGNGNLTKRVQDEDGTWGSGATRVTSIAYDYRNRAVLTSNPTAPHTVAKYDNANRVVAVGQYSSAGSLSAATDPTSTATSRVALSETLYDERGQVWQTIRWEIDQGNGAKGDALYADNWYDANGRSIKTVGPQIAKTAYDRLGRVTARSILAQANDSSYGDADDTATDTVLEEHRTAYDEKTGRPLLQYTVMRNHDDDLHTPPSSGGTGGPLDANADGDLTVAPGSITGRVQMSGVWYDDQDRVVETVNLGTNGGSSYTWSGTVPSRSDTALRTSTVYDDFGRVYQTFDPTGTTGVETRTAYDFRGRRTQVIENYQNGTLGGGADNDEDRITEYGYDGTGGGAGIGMLTSVTRKMPSSQDQVTAYHYGAVKGSNGSLISDNRLLLKTVLPPQYETPGVQPESDRRTLYAYNPMGEVVQTTDPAGNIIATEYDAAGRVIERRIDNLAGGFDGRVNKVQYDYTDRGQVYHAKQRDEYDTVLDAMAFTYDGFGNLIELAQRPDEVNGRDEIDVDLQYDMVGDRLIAPIGWRLDTHTARVGYDIAGNALDAQIGRISGVTDLVGSVTLSEYTYMGAGTAVGVSYPEPIVSSSLFAGGGSADYGDYLDRFNRPTLNQWVKDVYDLYQPIFVDLTMTWNRTSQPVTVKDQSVVTFDQKNDYDLLRWLGIRTEGTLTGASITTQNRKQTLARDIGGRTVTDQVTLNSDSDYTDGPPNAIDGGELDDGRTYNKRNELIGRSVNDYDDPSTPRPVTLAYDKNGNLTDDGEKYKYTYNPFGQLVGITLQNDDPIAVYAYNALGQRISEQLDTNDSIDSGMPDNIVDGYDPIFYLALDQHGRRIATYRGADTYPKETFVWHPAGVGGPAFKGGLLMRDRNDTLVDPTLWALEEASDTRAERHYACSDFRGDVVATVAPSGLEFGGVLVERARYTATGIPFGLPLGDIDCNGVTSTSGDDQSYMSALIGGGAYHVRADLNLDGYVDTDDDAILAASNGLYAGRGRLSVPGVGSRVGYRQMEAFGEGFGMIWNADHHAGLERTLSSVHKASRIGVQVNKFAFKYVLGMWQSDRYSSGYYGNKYVRNSDSEEWRGCVDASANWFECMSCCGLSFRSDCYSQCNAKHAGSPFIPIDTQPGDELSPGDLLPDPGFDPGWAPDIDIDLNPPNEEWWEEWLRRNMPPWDIGDDCTISPWIYCEELPNGEVNCYVGFKCIRPWPW